VRERKREREEKRERGGERYITCLPISLDIYRNTCNIMSRFGATAIVQYATCIKVQFN
jgi:hypothetical protein